MNTPDPFNASPLDLLRAELGRVGSAPEPATPSSLEPPSVQIHISGGQQGQVIGHVDRLTLQQTFVAPPDKS